MKFLLDAGALVAIDKRDRSVGAMLRVIQQQGLVVRTSAGVVAQIWRDGAKQANLARVLAGVRVRALDADDGRRAGELQRRSRTSDAIDAHLAWMADSDDVILTSDPEDMRRLLDAQRVDAVIRRV